VGESTAERLAAIEKQVENLNSRLKVLEEASASPPDAPGSATTAGASDSGSTSSEDASREIITVSVENKRFQGSNPMADIFQDHIWFDCTYEPRGLTKPARAVKGTIEFADLFGELKLALQVTINDPVHPSRAFRQSGVGFEFNEFLASHQWLRGTALSDMRISFKVEQVLYDDGSIERL